MKRFPLTVLILILAGSSFAQSGRRVGLPTPPRESYPERPSEIPAVRYEPVPVMPPVMSALPESILTRDLKSLNEDTFRLADFEGKVLVVNIWASWCGPCRAEIPDYEKVRKHYAGKRVEFIGLTTEDPRAVERVKKFARDTNFGFRLGWADPLTARTLMNGRGVIPQTLVIAADGRIISHWTGYSRSTSRDKLRDTIDRALDAGTASRTLPNPN